MEGWVIIKKKGYLTSSQQKVYGVLEHQQVMYYQGLHPDTHKPTGIVGSLNVQGGTVTRKKEEAYTHRGAVTYWVLITNGGGKKKTSLEIDTMTPTAWTAWGASLEKAVDLHAFQQKELAKFNGWRDALGFPPL